MQLLASFRVRSGHEDAVRALLGGYADVVRATAGTLLFEPSTVQGDPQEVVVFERYADEAAFRDHLAAPENAAFNARLVEHIHGDVTLRFLDPLASL